MPEVEVRHDGHPAFRRKVRFDWSNLPLHWVPDDPFATHVMNVLHLLLPEGERHFIKAVLEASSLVDDPERRRRSNRSFSRSPGTPGRTRSCWIIWPSRASTPRPYTDRLGRFLSVALGDPPKHWPRGDEAVVAYGRLADVAALEHFTAVLGEWVLQNRGLDYAGTNPVMLDLLRWHGAEKIEHRSLVYDVYQHVCGSYPLRALSMLTTAPQFVRCRGSSGCAF